MVLAGDLVPTGTMLVTPAQELQFSLREPLLQNLKAFANLVAAVSWYIKS